MTNDKDINIKSIQIFENTDAWELAKAVECEEINKIEMIVTGNPDVVNIQDPEYGITLLVWSIKMEKYKVAEKLLKLGANPNLMSKSGKTALFYAAEYSWIDYMAKKDARYVELLLKYKANPNISYVSANNEVLEPGTTPLMVAATISFEKTQALVEGGAEINLKTITGKTAASKALVRRFVDVAYYLIVEKKAVVCEPYYHYYIEGDSINFEKPYLPIESLEDWIFDLNSEEYRKKMAIVEAFKRQGQYYWLMKKHPKTVERIIKLYPDNWQEYLEKY
jgi:hypothetical protein